MDIDEPINDFCGTVHAYVGDEVTVSWLVADERWQFPRPKIISTL